MLQLANFFLHKAELPLKRLPHDSRRGTRTHRALVDVLGCEFPQRGAATRPG